MDGYEKFRMGTKVKDGQTLLWPLFSVNKVEVTGKVLEIFVSDHRFIKVTIEKEDIFDPENLCHSILWVWKMHISNMVCFYFVIYKLSLIPLTSCYDITFSYAFGVWVKSSVIVEIYD